VSRPSRIASAESTDPAESAAGIVSEPVIVTRSTPAPRPVRAGARKSRLGGWARLLSPVAVVVLWQAASSSGILPASKLASPASIVHTAYGLIVRSSPTYGTLQGSLLASLERWAIGFALGIAIGVLLAVITGLSRVGEVVADPILQALVWFGIGQLPKVLFVMLSALFPMYLNTFAGIRGVDSKLGELGHVLGLRRSELIRHIVLPGALPQALTGLQLSVISPTTSGLGFMITQAQQFLDNSVIMVALIVYAILGILLNGAVRMLERKALAWRRDFVE
jgi:sulfonate transport system permease protein